MFRNPEPAWIVIIGVPAILACLTIGIVTSVQRGRERRRRLELIEVALRNPSLAPEVQRELIQALRPAPRRATFVLGWLGAFAGIGWLCTEPRGEEFTAAVVLTVFAFACITLPLALRELETRKA